LRQGQRDRHQRRPRYGSGRCRTYPRAARQRQGAQLAIGRRIDPGLCGAVYTEFGLEDVRGNFTDQVSLANPSRGTEK
jgi:hypothetical protein